MLPQPFITPKFLPGICGAIFCLGLSYCSLFLLGEAQAGTRLGKENEKPRFQVNPRSGLVTIFPEAYSGALRNPLKGFRPYVGANPRQHRYMSLVQHYIEWNKLEDSASDDLVANIRAFSDKEWAKFKGTGVKIIPRVYLDWNKEAGNEYWPADMETGDYTSAEFDRRVERLVQAMGEAWDDDPRVAWVQMGIIGYWGEHHGPSPDAKRQQLLGELFTEAFKNKKVLVRHPNEFEDYEFGIYWDSWAHYDQTPKLKQGAGIEKLNRETGRWKTHPIEGEIAYNWGNYKIQAGDDPDDTLTDPTHREFLIDTIRNLHCSALGWVAAYSKNDAEAAEGAEAVQKVMGYRFVVDAFSYRPTARSGGEIGVSFTVRNTGSTPFYEDWPVQLNLLDEQTHEIVWRGPFSEVDVREWLPGDDWDSEIQKYRIPPETHTVTQKFSLPTGGELPRGNYIVALSIPDPQSEALGVRLAIENYFDGDLHPIGMFAYGVDLDDDEVALGPALFDDPMAGR